MKIMIAVQCEHKSKMIIVTNFASGVPYISPNPLCPLPPTKELLHKNISCFDVTHCRDFNKHVSRNISFVCVHILHLHGFP